jgi:hypothetical protein
MEFQDLVNRALQIREKYASLEKNQYKREWTREELVQGFVVDVGDLMRLVMGKSGIRTTPADIDEKLEEELADCLW